MPARNYFEALASQDTAVELSGQLKVIAVSLMKIANDLRWMNSGPLAGLAEIALPALQPGSSIMPGKVNPVIPEAVAMVAAQVIGHDAAITIAGSQGNFQLNAYKPIILFNVLESAELLADACRSFTAHCARGIEANKSRIRDHLEQSLMLVTALSPHIGYEKSAEIALLAHREAVSLRDAALKLGHVTADEFDAWVRPEDMVGPAT